MKNLKPTEIAKIIIRESKVNVFKNSRKQKYIEYRSLLCYLLREKLNMRWILIAKFFAENNKTMTHATCMHSFRNYSMYKKHNKNLKEIENLFTFSSDINIDKIDRVHYLENKCKLLENKLNKTLDGKLAKMISKIPENRETEAVERIGMIIKGWEWREKQ